MLSNGALKFSRVTLGDAGMYQCLAKNEAGVAVGRTRLVLQGNLNFSIWKKMRVSFIDSSGQKEETAAFFLWKSSNQGHSTKY